ncbi:hypothetical protein HK101_009745 [Irineochytrium annulatum]|nr:hypothetical protein HK101_009745 [Irineochytrium annulatum]
MSEENSDDEDDGMLMPQRANGGVAGHLHHMAPGIAGGREPAAMNGGLLRGQRAPLRLSLQNLGSPLHAGGPQSSRGGPVSARILVPREKARVRWKAPKPGQDEGGSPSEREVHDSFVVQLSMILDLDGVGMANLYVLNYGWIHAGIWSIIKTALPADSCKKLMFISRAELLNHFDATEILPEYAGLPTPSPPYSFASCPIFTSYDSDPSPNNASNLPTAQLLSVLAKINSLDIHAPTDDPDVWYDAPEWPMAPVRSAADLQTLLRPSVSTRNFGGSQGHGGSLLRASVSYGNLKGHGSQQDMRESFFLGLPSPRMTQQSLHGSIGRLNGSGKVEGSYFPAFGGRSASFSGLSGRPMRRASSTRGSNGMMAIGGGSQGSSPTAKRVSFADGQRFKRTVFLPWTVSMMLSRFVVRRLASLVVRNRAAQGAVYGNAGKTIRPGSGGSVIESHAKATKKRGGGIFMKGGQEADDDEDNSDDSDEDTGLLPIRLSLKARATASPLTPSAPTNRDGAAIYTVAGLVMTGWMYMVVKGVLQLKKSRALLLDRLKNLL